MASEGGSVLDKLVGEISSPWDWAAAAAGAALGAGATLVLHGMDAGTSIAAGATTGVAVRKALVASTNGWLLKRRARGLTNEIDKAIARRQQRDPVPSRLLAQISEELQREVALRESKAIDNAQFAARLDELVVKFRSACADLAPDASVPEGNRPVQAGSTRGPSSGPNTGEP